MLQLLSVGTSEAGLFAKGQDLLQQYKLQAVVRIQPGSTLDMCLAMIQEALTPTTDIITIWSLTPYAWKQTYIEAPQQPKISVFEPNPNVSIDQVPELMMEIVQYVYQQNRNCEVHLVIPSVKDIYQFNQTRIINKYGAAHQDFLQNHDTMNPVSMREHSRMVYQLFKDLEKDEFYWPNKRLMFGNSAINTYFTRSGVSHIPVKPHVAYLKGESLSLNLSLLPDGLNGSHEFLKYFMVNNSKVFSRLLKRTRTHISESFHSPPTSFGGPSPHNVSGGPQIASAAATIVVNSIEDNNMLRFQQSISDAAPRVQSPEERFSSLEMNGLSTSRTELIKSSGMREYSPQSSPDHSGFYNKRPRIECSSQSIRNISHIPSFSPATYQACVRNLINSFCPSGGDDRVYKLHVIRKIKEALDYEEKLLSNKDVEN